MPNYRQEVSLYAAAPSLAVLHSAATTDSWHERVGAAGDVAGRDGAPSSLWVRLIGNSGERRGDALGIYGRNGPAYDHKTTALQLGGDLYRDRDADGRRSAAGLYLATGRSTGDVRHFDGQKAGSLTLDVHSVGGYWTRVGEQGGYVDVVAQGNHYSLKAASTRMPAVKTSGSGYELSVEGGQPYRLDASWQIEPQLQLRLLRAELGQGHDIAGQVRFGDAKSLVGRAGVKLGYQSGAVAAWGRLDVLNEFEGRSRTTVSSLAGLYGVDFASSVRGASVGLSAGIDAKISQSASFYGALNYRRALGDSRGHAWSAQAGVKVAW